MEFVVLGLAAAAVFIVFLLWRISAQKRRMDDLYNRAMYEKYMADMVTKEYQKMLDDYITFREEIKQTMEN